MVEEEVVEVGRCRECVEADSDRCGAGASLAEERRRMAAIVLEGVSADWGIGRRRKAAMAQGGT